MKKKKYKKKNQLSMWKFPYRPLHYITHPWKLMQDIILNVKNMWHRARYGFAYVDVWNFLDWYPRVGAAALEYLALHKCGYPGHEPWETPEKWRDYLQDLAARLEKCADSMDILYSEDNNLNEYSEKYHEAFNALTYHEEELENGMVRTWRDETPEYKEIREKYFEREKEIQDELQRFREETYHELGNVLAHLWD